MTSNPLSRRLVITGAFSAIAWSAVPHGEPSASAATPDRWRSGAGDPQAANVAGGGFGRWRGRASTYARVWADASLRDMRGVWMMDAYKTAGWTGTLDVACGGPQEGQTWRTAATGGLDATWRTTCRAVRSKWGRLAEVHLSMAHELNGTWYPWSVNRTNVADFKRAWARWYRIVQEELVAHGLRARVCLNLNSDTLSDVSVDDLTPARHQFDLLGSDFYSMWPDLRDQASWNKHQYATGIGGSPRGITAWFEYARALGKPITFPEWGVNAQSRSDNPFFVRAMRNAFAAHAGTDPARPGPGQVAGEAYFNHLDQCRLWPTTVVAQTARAYRALSWGS